jgi:hypothetical protein
MSKRKFFVRKKKNQKRKGKQQKQKQQKLRKNLVDESSSIRAFYLYSKKIFLKKSLFF